MPPNRVIRDPDKIKTNGETFTDAVLAQEGVWEPVQLIEMDARFAAAMTRNAMATRSPHHPQYRERRRRSPATVARMGSATLLARPYSGLPGL